jgi:hypothetical protein
MGSYVLDLKKYCPQRRSDVKGNSDKSSQKISPNAHTSWLSVNNRGGRFFDPLSNAIS